MCRRPDFITLIFIYSFAMLISTFIFYQINWNYFMKYQFIYIIKINNNVDFKQGCDKLAIYICFIVSASLPELRGDFLPHLFRQRVRCTAKCETCSRVRPVSPDPTLSLLGPQLTLGWAFVWHPYELNYSLASVSFARLLCIGSIFTIFFFLSSFKCLLLSLYLLME